MAETWQFSDKREDKITNKKGVIEKAFFIRYFILLELPQSPWSLDFFHCLGVNWT